MVRSAGQILQEDYLNPLGISAYRLSQDIHVPVSRIQEILLDQRKITADTSARLGVYFGLTPGYFLQVQDEEELAKAKEEIKEVLSIIKPHTLCYNVPRGNNNMEFNRLIDHTLLAPDATKAQIKKICDEAKQYHFMSVCVNPCWVPFCAEQLKGTDTGVCTVIGFPLGATSTASKVFEARQALADGAKEIDMVINIGMLKDHEDDYVENEIKALKAEAGKRILKVIIETCLLTDEEKVRACQLSKKAGADFVKTSTGFSKWGAKPEDVALMRKTVGPEMGVKASGGVRNREDAQAMVDAGATRLGTSHGIDVIK